MLHPNPGPPTATTAKQPNAMEAPEGEATVLPKTTPTSLAWSKTASTKSKRSQKSRCFEDITAEQKEDRLAARAARDSDVSLVSIQADQDRPIQSMQARRQLQPQQPSGVEESKHETQAKSSSTDTMEEDDMIVLEMVMRQSLAEFNVKNNVKNNVMESKEGGEDQEPVSKEERGETVEPLRSAHPPLRSNSMNELHRNESTHSTLSQPSKLHRQSEAAIQMSTTTSRPALGDRDFSRRTLREIERTEIVIDNPHADATDRHRRLTKSSSARRPSNPPPNTLQNAPRSVSARGLSTMAGRTSAMNEAKKHLSSREITEIEKALRDADEEQQTSPFQFVHTPQPLRRKTSLSRRNCINANRSPTRNVHISPSLSPRLKVSPRSPVSFGKLPPTSPFLEHTQAAIQSPRQTTLAPSLPALSVASLRNASTPIDSTTEEEFGDFLSQDEAAAIEAALREADAKEEAESLMLAFQMQQEEISQIQQHQQQPPFRRQTQGNVRNMNHAELDHESQRVSARYQDESTHWIGAVHTSQPPPLHPLEQQALSSLPHERARGPGAIPETRPPARHPLDHEEEEEPAGFRLNSSSAQQRYRRDRNTIIGPNNEVRTKHDVHVQGQANAHILGRTSKGVATHDTDRAGSDSDATKGKAMDPHLRLEISRAVNSGLIDGCNGAVKQGKGAIIYHADRGAASNGFDVAVKVFKRMQEFPGRGEYVDGDPRYAGRTFRKSTEREQLELWTEKEFRNLVRANRAMVPVPTPLHYKDNIIFMRFMGNSGWPAPQIRDIEMRKGSKQWDVLYTQVMEAIRRLYVGARLVHGDLSEHKILVAPAFQVDNPISSAEDAVNDLQAVLIDFGQSVDLRHPEAMNLLRRDLGRVRAFFSKQGVKTLGLEDAVEFVVDDFSNENTPDLDDSSKSVVSHSNATMPT